MPTYGYECTACGEQFEVNQRITDEPLTIHEGCGGELRKLVYPVGIVFKGSGFYVNDYSRKTMNSNSESVTKPSEAKSEETPKTPEKPAETASATTK